MTGDALAELAREWRAAVELLDTPDSLRSWLADVACRLLDEAEADGQLAFTDRQLVQLSHRLPEPLALELLRRRIIRDLARQGMAA